MKSFPQFLRPGFESAPRKLPDLLQYARDNELHVISVGGEDTKGVHLSLVLPTQVFAMDLAQVEACVRGAKHKEIPKGFSLQQMQEEKHGYHPPAVAVDYEGRWNRRVSSVLARVVEQAIAAKVQTDL